MKVFTLEDSFISGLFSTEATKIGEKELKIKTKDRETLQDHLYARSIISTEESYGLRIRDKKSLITFMVIVKPNTYRDDKLQKLESLIENTSNYGKLHPSLNKYI